MFWRYRSSRSGGSSAILASGVAARLWNTVRMSYPLRQSYLSVLCIFAIYLYIGHPPNMLLKLLDQHSRIFPKVYSPSTVEKIQAAIKLHGAAGAHHLSLQIESVYERPNACFCLLLIDGTSL